MRISTKSDEDTPKRRGPKTKDIDMALVEKLAQIHCTDEEIAGIVGVSHDTLGRRKKQQPEFAERLTRARLQGKASLRRLQWQAAQSGSIPMLIWLGKQLLGQRDRFDDQPLDLGPLPWTD
jgi:hypothetical protein